jgi:hypothetical protein
MADQLYMEDLMGRIRSLVRVEAKGAGSSTRAADQVLARLRERVGATVPEVSETDGAEAMHGSRELTGLWVEVESCVSASAMVGEINPRHPGWLNDQVQSGKRLMRRSLSWYTRPLRLFHGAVVRAMQQMAAALEKQQEMLSRSALQKELLETNHRLNEVEWGTCQLYEIGKSAMEKSLAQAQATSVELQDLREELKGLRAELIATRRQLEETLSESRSPKGFTSN